MPSCGNSQPFSLRKMTLHNRVVMASMGQYSAENGEVNDWHLVHYGSRATGGVGLILTEMTSVSETGRITLACTGIYSKEKITIAYNIQIDDIIALHFLPIAISLL